ncbi:hypothetical protein PEBR_33608 [Penicillium brasilianum]|uniref:Uncharacterized protein n=1 Tax=Penicillium brasilianum TaxID=104259 RepID=A0A1S9RFB3_PENBI|nr:hypothetical protein PEBR_33608 [Penicillium brasilianum]
MARRTGMSLDISELFASTHSTSNGATARGWPRRRAPYRRLYLLPRQLGGGMAHLPGPRMAARPSHTAAHNTRSNGTSSPVVPEIELREDREVIVKVGPNREQIRELTPKDLVEWAERPKTTSARQSSGVLAGQASFVAARKLLSGDVAMIANSAAGAEVLRKHPTWLRAFGPGSVIQEPSWGVVAQNNWGEGSRIQYLGWLTRPVERAEGSILIEFTSPVVVNGAIITGVVWGKQIHNASRFCREGRMKLRRKCQKPGHIQSHCSNVFKCGHCAGEHPTWECPSTKGQAISIKCANCSEGHRPTSRECPVKIAAMNEAKQALAGCPTYHRIPLHFRTATRSDEATNSTDSNTTAMGGMEASIHAPTRQQEEESSTRKALKPRNLNETLAAQKAQRPDQRLPNHQSYHLHARDQRGNWASQRATQEDANSKWRRTGEPEDAMDEQPDDNDWFNIQLNPVDFPQTNTQQDSHENRLSQFIGEVTTLNDAHSTPEPSGAELDPESPNTANWWS